MPAFIYTNFLVLRQQEIEEKQQDKARQLGKPTEVEVDGESETQEQGGDCIASAK